MELVLSIATGAALHQLGQGFGAYWRLWGWSTRQVRRGGRYIVRGRT